MTSGERDQVRAELEHEERARARMLTGLANTHLSHWKHPLQLAASDRHIARLRALLAADGVAAAPAAAAGRETHKADGKRPVSRPADRVIQPADHGTDLDGPCAVAGRGGRS